ncbi:MAG: single-stranded DNA-binding protein [Anaerolineaceae bacterium]|nr:single-stranded DNA-binding protein [Anaerolineaceae bacterium]
MPQGLNKVMLIGYLGRDPELRYTPSGRSVTTFSMATSRSWTGQDNEKHTQTEWFNIVAWGNLAEICKELLNKGKRVYIEGRLQSRTWEDSEGNKKKSVDVIANEMIVLSSDYPEFEDEIDQSIETDEEHLI